MGRTEMATRKSAGAALAGFLAVRPAKRLGARSRRRAVSAPRQRRFRARCQACHAAAMTSPAVLASGLLARSLISAEES